MNAENLDPGNQAEGEVQEKPKLDLAITVDAPSTCERHVTVTIAEQDVRRYFDEAFSELMPKAAVPGFRPGRAPRKLVEQRFREQVAEQIKGSLLLDTLSQVTEEQKLAAISEPEFDLEAIEVPDEGPMTFEFDLEVRPEFDTPQWKGLTLDRPVHQFSQKEIDDALEDLVTQTGEMEEVESIGQQEDFVVANVEFRHNGKTLSRLQGELICVRPELSFSDAILPDFFELLKGARPGERRTATVQISTDAPNEQLRGQEVDAELEVVRVQRMKTPEITEQVLRDHRVDSEGALRDQVHAKLNRQLHYFQQQRIREQITTKLTESAEWDLPPELVRRQAKREGDRMVLELRSAGFTEEEIQARRNELRQNSQRVTERALKEHFILERIAEDESIDASDQDFEAEIRTIAEQSGEPVRRVRASIEKRGIMDVLRNQIIERKVINLIASQANFRDVPFDPAKRQVEAIEHFVAGHAESDIPVAKYSDESQGLSQPADYT